MALTTVLRTNVLHCDLTNHGGVRLSDERLYVAARAVLSRYA